MDTIYFVLFCLFIAYLIYWMVKNDDLAEFTGEETDKRFKPPVKDDDQ
ncbi:MAG: hypothetical protein HWE25_08325 [Alphaproteobacteria bacterium]|nr:hypothetical protein [Alphaproteobacteria bacterium]